MAPSRPISAEWPLHRRVRGRRGVGRGPLVGILVVGVLVIGFVLVWPALSPAGPQLPIAAPETMNGVDPALAARLSDATDAVTEDPFSPQARRTLGLVYAANDMPSFAATCLEQALTLGDAEAATRYHLAHARADAGDIAGAIAAVEEVARDEPTYAPAHWQRGLWYLEIGRADDASAAFDACIETDPSEPAGWHGRARVLMQRGQPEAAIEILENETARDGGGGPYTWHLLGTAYRRLGRVDEAQAALERGRGGRLGGADPWRGELADYREGYQAQLDRARALAAAGQYQEAVTLLGQMRRSRRVTIEVFNNLGLCYLALRRGAEAIDVLEEGIDLNDGSVQTHHLLAGAYRARARAGGPGSAEDEARWRRHLDRALEISPGFAPALGMQAEERAQQGDVDGAIAAYREAARYDPDNPQWNFQAAVLAGHARRWSEVVACLEQVTRRHPDHADALGRLGVAYMMNGQLEEAETTLLKARERFGPDERIDAALAQVRRQR